MSDNLDDDEDESVFTGKSKLNFPISFLNSSETRSKNFSLSVVNNCELLNQFDENLIFIIIFFESLGRRK